jgi:acyl-CoA thioester hydrolase
MGCMHHSRYLVWLEEARLKMAAEAHIDFNALTKEKVYFPLMEIFLKYHRFAYCGDEVLVSVTLERPTKFAKLVFNYKVHRKKGMELLLTAQTIHNILIPGKGLQIGMSSEFMSKLLKVFDNFEDEDVENTRF